MPPARFRSGFAPWSALIAGESAIIILFVLDDVDRSNLLPALPARVCVPELISSIKPLQRTPQRLQIGIIQCQHPDLRFDLERRFQSFPSTRQISELAIITGEVEMDHRLFGMLFDGIKQDRFGSHTASLLANGDLYQRDSRVGVLIECLRVPKLITEETGCQILPLHCNKNVTGKSRQLNT